MSENFGHQISYARDRRFVRTADEPGLYVLASALDGSNVIAFVQLGRLAADACGQQTTEVTGPDDIVEWLTSNEDLDVVGPVPGEIGGRRAQVIDVETTSIETCPQGDVVLVQPQSADLPLLALGNNEHVRFHIISMPDGAVFGVLVRSPNQQAFELFSVEARVILDTVEVSQKP